MKVYSIFLLISLFALMESSLDGFQTKYCSDYSGTTSDKQAYHADTERNTEQQPAEHPAQPGPLPG